jgi:hypothetical protein
MFDRVNTQTSMHTYIRALAGFTTRIGQQPLSAGCSEYCHAQGLCNMPSQPGTACSICLMVQPIGIGTSMPDRCATRTVAPACCHLLVFVLFLAAQGLCNMLCCQHSQVQVHGMCLTASTHANKHAHIFTLFCCSDCAVAAAQAILITAACTGFVQQSWKSGYSLQGHSDRQNTSNRVH